MHKLDWSAVAVLAPVLLLAACDPGVSPAGFGEPCTGNADCASGLCLILPASSTCTQACTSDCDCPSTHGCAPVTVSESVCAPGPTTCGSDAGTVDPPDGGPADAGPPDGGSPVCTISSTGPLEPSGTDDVASLCVDFDSQTCLRLAHNDCLDSTPSAGNPVIFVRDRTAGYYLIAANTNYVNTTIDGVSHGAISGRTAYGIPADTDVSFLATWTGGQFFVVVRFSGASVTILRFERYTGG